MRNWVANNRTDAMRMALALDKELVIMSYNIHNPNVVNNGFNLELWDGTEFKATILDTIIEPKDTLFLDTKLIISRGQYLKFNSDKEIHIIISGT